MTGTYTLRGFCPICEAATTFQAANNWYRDSLNCPSCINGSVPRERALALVLSELRPNWRELSIHESSPAHRGISVKMLREAPKYCGSQYYPDLPAGEYRNGYRNENLERLSLADESVDITITLDVMEHVYDPESVFKEIHRTLKPGGVYICTFPVRKYQTEAMVRRFEWNADGTRNDFVEPEIHGNPVDSTGSIVTVDWGYDLHQLIGKWVPMSVRVYRFHDPLHGIIGEYTDLIVCQKMRSGS